jgi:hypothetical protein
MKYQVSVQLFSLVLLWGIWGCSSRGNETSSDSYSLRVQVRTSQGTGLSGAKVTVEEKAIGTTGSQGLVETRINGREGQAIRVNVDCPKGYRAMERPEAVRLAKTRSLGNSNEQPGTNVELICESELREVVVVVNAQGGSELPIRVGTLSAGATDGQGNAQFLVHLDREQSAVEIGIDTEARRELVPRNPSRTFNVGRNDAIIVYREQLVAEKVKPKARRWAKRQTRDSRPIRLD